MDYTKSLIEFVKNGLLLGQEKFTIDADTQLLETGIVDSLGIMRLLQFIEENFKISVDGGDVVMENFMTIRALSDFISTLASQGDGASRT